jgi:hypothetical protein
MSDARMRVMTREALLNWLALATLVALGFVGPGADAPGRSATVAAAPAAGGGLQLAAVPARRE